MIINDWKQETIKRIYELNLPDKLFNECFRLLQQMDYAYCDDTGQVDMALLDASMAKIDGIIEASECYILQESVRDVNQLELLEVLK